MAVGVARRALVGSVSLRLLVLWRAASPLAADVARAQSTDPTEIVTFHDEAGKQAQTVVDDAGADHHPGT